MKNYDEAVKMYQKGMSVGEVATFYRVTRQAMWMILKRRGVQFRDNLRYGTTNHFYRGTKASDLAQNIAEKAVKKGVIQRKTHCEICETAGVFKDGRSKIQMHHADYAKPLDVMWLCQPCHHKWHKEHTAKGSC